MAPAYLSLVGSHGKEETIDLFARHVSSGKAGFFQAAGIDFVLGRREGPYLWDIAGEKRLIDCHCNGGVFNLGHRNPEVIAALVAAFFLESAAKVEPKVKSGSTVELEARLSESPEVRKTLVGDITRGASACGHNAHRFASG